MRLLPTLKFQLTGAMLLIVLLFVATQYQSLDALQQQQRYNMLLNLTARLGQTAENISSIGMRFAMKRSSMPDTTPPGILPYYQEMVAQMRLFGQITDGFMSERFAPELTSMEGTFAPTLDPAVHRAVESLETVWMELRDAAREILGSDPSPEQMAHALDYIAENSLPVNEAVDALRSQLQRQIDQQLLSSRHLHWILLTIALLLMAITLFWLYRSVLTPLAEAVRGFRKVSQGDFGHQVPVRYHNEIAQLTISFNRLSSRLNAIFRLIDKIQQGSDLDDALCFVAEQFPSLLPLDWVGALFVARDTQTIILEGRYYDSRQEVESRSRFRLHNTLLQQALEKNQPLHIPDMQQTAAGNPQFQFLNYLAAKGLRDAIFLPIIDRSEIPIVLAFGTRSAATYTAEHLELLTNIAGLICHSFGRTVKLAEHGRLAAIGGFASGIAHEIRSPLSTITMALDYFRKADLPESGIKRAELAYEETQRMARLLEEILLYAKPVQLQSHDLDLAELVQQMADTHTELFAQRHQQLAIEREADTRYCVAADPNRMKQVVLNLLRNASESAPTRSRIRCRLQRNLQAATVELTIHNGGPTIPESALPHLFEPFFTTKGEGTGLGLAIVKRLVEAHGGSIELHSSEAEGTCAIVQLPMK